MKLFIAALTAVLTALIVFAAPCSAEFGTDELYAALPDEARDELEEGGITVNGGAENLSVGYIWDKIVSALTENADKPLRMFVSVIAVVLLASLISGVSDATGGMTGVCTLVASLSATVIISAYLRGWRLWEVIPHRQRCTARSHLRRYRCSRGSHRR